MAAPTYDSIMADLKAGKYASVYLLQGDEPFYIDKITSYIENNVLTDDQKVFNQTVVYGKDLDIRNLDSLARRFPAMAQYQVVIVKEAQELKKIEDLVYYVQKPQKSTILVLAHKYKTLDKRKKLASQIEKSGVLFTSTKLYENKIPGWIEQYAKQMGLQCDPRATRLLTEYLGTDLSKISNELDKLAITLPKGAPITPEAIEKNIGISKDYNNFELQNVICRGDVAKAARIVDHFAKNQKDNPLVLTITSLYGFYSKMLIYWQYKSSDASTKASAMGCSPYFLRDYDEASRRITLPKCMQAISLLREYDLRSKGVGNASTDAGALLQELVFKLMH
ncbi:MAG: DNA polymerase III subunit delta [Bacteroidales bacterium]|nr:DNA polymerase III subunit delta [Bacteroidales bacterium]